MIRIKGRYRQGKVELEQPIDVPDGTPVEVTVQPPAETADEDWRELGIDRLEQEWNNERDAVYDDWRRLYGVQQP
jgi:hypothetical protein